MKRGGPLARVTPLVARTPMRRTKWVPSLAPQERVERTSKLPSKPRRDTGFPAVVRDLVAERSGGVCERCGVAPAEHRHHRRARGMGSTRRPDTSSTANCLHICRPCHEVIESHREWALVHGWLVNQSHEPSRVQVQLHHGWVRLDDQGGFEPSEGGDW